MTKKKKLLSVILAAFAAIFLAAGVYLACGGSLFAFAEFRSTNGKLSISQLDANSEYLTGTYIDAYGVPAAAIKSYETDGGVENGSLSNIFDRNFSTTWRSKTAISEMNPSVSLTVFFQDAYKLDGFIYQSEGGGRGYFTNLKISYHDAKAFDKDPFEEYDSIQSSQTGNTVYVKFQEQVEMTAIKLEWTAAPKSNGQSTASAAEISFLQPEDENVKEALKMFSDYAQLELNEEVTEEKITELRGKFEKSATKRAAWESYLDPLLTRALQILSKTLKPDPHREMSTADDATNKLWRHGDIASYARNTLKFSNFGTNRQATGVSSVPGEKIIVYVDADENDPLPSLVFSQHWGTAMMAWKSGEYTLHRGRNEIVTPHLHYWGLHDNNGENCPRGGPIYLVNPYLPKEETKPEGRPEKTQSNKVKVYIEGGTAIPIFRKGGDVETYLSDLRDYAELVEQDRLDNYETGNYTVVDVTEVVCDRMTLTVQATRGNEYYNDLGYNPQKACENWDDYVKKLLMFDGIVFKEEDEVEGSEEFNKKLESVNAKYDSRNEWLSVNIRLMQPWGAAYAAPEHVGIQVGWDGSGLIGEGWGWGYSHEIGHMLDITERLVGESSNNMISKFDETVLEKTASRGDFAENVLKLSPNDHMASYFNTNRLNFTIWWLIESYFPGYWAKQENLYRYGDLYKLVTTEERYEKSQSEQKTLASLNATEKQIYYSSIVTGIDLRYYFERWGYNLSGSDKIFKAEEASPLFDLMMQRATEQHLISKEFQPKLWYLDAAEWWARYDDKSYADNPCFNKDYEKGSLYKETDAAPKISTVTKSGSGYSLMIDKDDKFSDPNHLGYEVQVKQVNHAENEWKVVGFTSGRIFTDTNTYAEDYVPEYRLVAYDRALRHTKEGASTSASGQAISNVCKIVRDGQDKETYNSVAEAVANAKDGDTIVLLKDSYESGIVIDKELTIKTNGNQVTLTKSGNAPIFTVVENTVDEEKIGEDGQVVKDEYVTVKHTGKLTLEGSESAQLVLDGFQIETEGSLVRVQAGELTVKYCTFQDAIFKWGNDSMGGALRFEGGKLDVSNTTFKNNSARLGGAVCVTHRDGSSVNFKNCTFENNNAREGGGVYNTGTITFESCTFKKNSVESVGGGFANVSGGVINVKDCTFEENTAGNRGGGFYSDGMVDLRGGSFTGNTAEDGAAFAYWRTSGAARYFYAKPSDTDQKLPVISNNKSENGAAVILHGRAENVKLDIENNDTKYALRVGGEVANLEEGTKILGDIFRESSGNVVLKSMPEFKNSDTITVATDSEQANLVLFTSGGSGVTFDENFAKRFQGENGEQATIDDGRNQIVFTLNSYTVTFEMEYEQGTTEKEVRHYRPGRSFTFESFSGDKTKQWYVAKWTDPDGKEYEPGDTFTVNADITFKATIGRKFKIEVKVDPEFENMGVQSKTFYAMVGEKYTLSKLDVEGYIHNGWEYSDANDETTGKPIVKSCQPVTSFRANRDRVYRAVIVKKLTVSYYVPSRTAGEGAVKYAERTYGYGSKIEFVNCEGEYADYVPGFIEGFYIRYSNDTLSTDLVDFDTFQITSDLNLVAKVVDEASMVGYVIYDDGYGGDGEFLGSKMDILELNSTYTVDLLPIPTGYHLVQLMLDGEPVEESQFQNYSFQLTAPSYVFIAYVTKDTYSINYSCNGVHFRTDTVLYGSVLSFNDPTNTLLKEAMRGYEGVKEGEYHFINYQLVSPNPQKGEEGQPDTVKLNIMLGDQITVTGNISVDILAYVEGYETPVEEDGGDVVGTWRTTHQLLINELAADMMSYINDPLLALTDAQKKEYSASITDAVAKAGRELSNLVLYEEIRSVWDSFELQMGALKEKIANQSAKNIAFNAIESAKQDALKAFDGKDDTDGLVTQAKQKIEQAASEATNSVQTSTDSTKYNDYVSSAQEKMRQIVERCNGDRLVLQRNNAITGVRSRAEAAKREISALTYLSDQMEGDFIGQIDDDLADAIDRINAIQEVEDPIESVRVGRVLRAVALDTFKTVDIDFANQMGYITTEAQKMDAAKKEQADELRAHAADVSGQIEAALAAATKEIQEDGIILSNAELIESLTKFATEKREEITRLLDAALLEITNVYEEANYEPSVKQIVGKAKEDISAQMELVTKDFAQKIGEAEQTNRAEAIRLRVTDPATAALERLDALTLSDESRTSYKARITSAQEIAEKAIQEAGDSKVIDSAVETFNAEVESVRLASEKESAEAVITAKVQEAEETLQSYDFLDDDWRKNYKEQIENAAQVAKTQIEADGVSANSVIEALATFTSTAESALELALAKNMEKGEAAKTAALEQIAAAVQSAKTAIDGYGFVTEDEKTNYKNQLDAISLDAINNASSQADLTIACDTVSAGVEEVSNQANTANESNGKTAKDTAKANAQHAFELYKNAIDELRYLDKDNYRANYISQIETRLTQANAAFDAAQSAEAVEKEQSAFYQAIRTAYAAAVERNNQIKGDEIAGEIVNAIKAVSATVTEARGKSDSFTFFTDAQKKSYSDELDAALKAATDEIGLAKSKEEAASLQAKHTEAVAQIVSKTEAEHAEIKQAAIAEAVNNVKAIAEAAAKEIEALEHLVDKAAFLTKVNDARTAAESAINGADAPEAITAAVKEFETKVNAAKTEAHTADTLAAEKTAQSAHILEAKQAAEAALALGFLSEEEISGYQQRINAAHTKVTGEIYSATNTDDVRRAVSTYDAELAAIKSESERQNSSNETAAKDAAKENVNTTAKSETDAVESNTYLTSDDKDGYRIEINMLAQTAVEKITSATKSQEVEDAVEEFNAALTKLQGEIDSANIESKQANTENALARVQAIETDALSALSAHTFLSEEQVNEYKAQIQEKTNGARTAIEGIQNIDEIDETIAALLKEVGKISENAKNENEKNAESAKSTAIQEIAAQQAKDQSTLNGLDSLTVEESGNYSAQLTDAYNLARTRINDATTPAAIDSAKTQLKETVKGILEGATLQNAKNAAIASAESKAAAAKTTVEQYTFDSKQTYLDKIEAALDAAKSKIDAAETADDATAAVTDLETALATIVKEAEGDQNSADLANAKAQARARFSEAQKKCESALSALTFLTEAEKDTYKAQMTEAIEEAEASLSEKNSVDAVNEVAASLEKSLDALAQTAELNNETHKTALKEKAIQEAEEEKKAAASIERPFIGDEDQTAYTTAIETAFTQAQMAIEGAGELADIDEALEVFHTAIEHAKLAAIDANAKARTEAIKQATADVEKALKETADAIDQLGFINSTEYRARLLEAVNAAREDLTNVDDKDELTEVQGNWTSAYTQIKSDAESANDAAKTEAVGKATEAVTESANNTKAACALGFLDKNAYDGEIDSAVAKANGAIKNAGTQGKINDALAELNKALEAIEAKAADANAQTAANAKEAASDEVHATESTKKELVDSWGFLTVARKQTYTNAIETAVATAVNEIEAAENQNEINAATAKFNSDVEAQQTSAGSENDQIKTSAQDTANATVDGETESANAALGSLGFINTEASLASVKEKSETAKTGIQNAATQADIDKAIATLLATLKDITDTATDGNETARQSAVNEAKGKIAEAQENAKSLFSSLGFISEEDYAYVIDSAVASATEAVEAAKSRAEIQAALVTLHAALEGVRDRAQNANKPAREYVTEEAKKAITEEAQKAKEDIRALKYVVYATYEVQIDNAAQEATSAIEGAGNQEAIGTALAAFRSKVETAVSNATSDNVAALKEKVKSEADAMKKTIDALSLSDEKKEEFKAEVDNVLNDAQGQIDKPSADPDGIFKAFQEAVKYIGEEADKASKEEPEDEPVQVVVEGIRALGKAYDATDSVEFDVSQVVYRNAKTGEEIDGTLFELSVSGRLSEYHVGTQVALITSITLSGIGVDAGEYVLSVRGQQAFAEVEVVQTRLIVRVNSDGTVGYDGFVGGDDESVLSGKLELTYTQNADGTFTVTPCGLESLDYDIEFVSGIVSAPDWSGLWIALAAAALVSAAFVAGILLKKKRR